MPEYLLEMYVSASDSTAADTAAVRVREASEAVASEGGSVRYLRSMFLAAEETCFVLLAADTVAAVEDVARLAHVPSNRIIELAGVYDVDRGRPETADDDPATTYEDKDTSR
jgi:hypothetical protein